MFECQTWWHLKQEEEQEEQEQEEQPRRWLDGNDATGFGSHVAHICGTVFRYKYYWRTLVSLNRSSCSPDFRGSISRSKGDDDETEKRVMSQMSGLF